MAIDDLARTPVTAIAQRRPVLVTAELTVDDVIRRIAAAGRGHAIVVDPSGRAIGIFTQRDLLTRIDPREAGWGDTPISAVMTREPVTISQDATLADCLAALRSRRIRSLPVCDGGKPVGVVSIRDILRHVAEVFPDEFLCLPPDPSLEASRPWGG